MASHLVAFYAATSGLNGASLGCDEEDIVLIQYLIYDIREAKVLTEQQYIVKPNGADVNENLLGETCREEYGLTEEQVKAGQPLETVIDSFDAIVNKLCDDGYKVNLLTDGQLHLRQVLHPKAVSKGMELPYFYHNFFDIRKEFKSFYHSAGDVFCIKDMTDHLDIKFETDTNLAVRSVRDMSKIVERMVREGHRFALPEVINIRLEPGICTRSEEVDSGCVVRARGLPWQSSDQDIAKFFRGLNIAKGGVALCLSPQGRRNGEALVRFVAAEHRDMALKRHKHHIGNRYIEVYKATGEDFINVAGGNNNEAQQFLSKGGQVIIRMRGLPYDCSAKQVVEFFEAGENGCDILDGEDGVLFVRKPDGRATGDAFVLFAREDDSTKALAKHRETIGSRYIELFRSTTAEVQQVLNRSMDPRTFEQQQPLIGQLPQMPMLPQQFITASNRRDCIRLRGLPYEAQVEHVLEFLGEHAKSIVFRGVHMVINAQGQPSGEAFIQMDSEQSAFMAAQNRHHRYMVFGKKQRYIEVFQCSGEDMNVVLSGAIPPQRTVVSPGMFMWDQSTALASPPLTPTPQPQGAILPPGAAQRQFPIPGTMLPPPFHQTPTLQAPNGTFLPSMIATQIKPEQMILSNGPLGPSLPPHMRQPTIIQQQTLEMPHASQASMVSPMKPGAMSPQTRAIHQAMLAQYGDFGLANQHIAVSSASPQMFLFPGAKLPTGAFPFPPQMQFVAVSTSMDSRNAPQQSFQPKYTLASHPLLSVPYVTTAQANPFGAHQAAMRTQIPFNINAGAKRSFEQAFTANDKNSVMRQIKRPPPRFTSPLTNPRITQAHLQPTQIPPPNLTPNTGVPPQPLNAITMSAQMLPALYPPPQMYPPAI